MFEHILVPLDGSPLAECILPHGLAIARSFGSRMTLIHIVERVGAEREARSVDPLAWHIRKTEAEAYLNDVGRRLKDVGANVQCVIREGQAAEQIIDFAHAEGVNLVCLSSHGKSGLSGWNISSVVQKITLRAYVPVMIVRAYQQTAGDLAGIQYRRLLVPLDGSLRAECVLRHATALAEFHGAKLLLTHIIARPPLVRRAPPLPEDVDLVNQLTERNRVEASRYLRQLQSQLSLDVNTQVLISDNVTTTLHELVKRESVDLVMLCAHGQSGSIRWPYGNVALSFIAYGTAPLLVIQDVSQDEVESTEAELASREHKGH